MNGSLAVAAKAQIITPAPDGLRLMVLVPSNAYQDREQEIVSQKALEQYVADSWDEITKEFIGDNPLLVWHDGDPIGDIIAADTEGPFLLEIARERPNAVINLAGAGEEPVLVEIKAVWDVLERESDVAVSHQFLYVTRDREDGVYEYIRKTETSVLPRWAAANYFTEAQVIGVIA
jgi:hypothetical protein